MGGYGGQHEHGSMRLRFREKASAAVSRLRSELPFSVSSVGFDLRYNVDFDIVKSLVENPLSQDELIAKINVEAASGDLALSIISTWHLKDLSGVTVCDQIKGLVLFGNQNLLYEAITAFLGRCPNPEALVLASDMDMGASFVHSVFQSN
jgi:hypothetical protein